MVESWKRAVATLLILNGSIVALTIAAFFLYLPIAKRLVPADVNEVNDVNVVSVEE
jgi:hypothetical protein